MGIEKLLRANDTNIDTLKYSERLGNCVHRQCIAGPICYLDRRINLSVAVERSSRSSLTNAAFYSDGRSVRHQVCRISDRPSPIIAPLRE